MTREKHIAVIDIGKTNAKLVLLGQGTKTQIAVVSMENKVLQDPPYPHYDIDGIWRFLSENLTDFDRCFGVDAISITTHGACAVLLAGDDLALPVLDYEFDGPEELAAEYEVVRPDFSQTLSPRLPVGLNLGAQIYWQAKRFPDAFAKVTSILMYPQFWAWKLTGVLALEVTSLGTHTDLWSPSKGGFSGLVEAMGWRKLFPEMKAANEVLGNAALIDVSVVCGIHDSNASLLPYLGRSISVVSSGTWTIIMTIGGDTSQLDKARDSLANVDMFGRPVPTARFMGGREFEVLTKRNKATPDVVDVSTVVQLGARILPSFTEGVGPFPNANGRWVGAGDLSQSERAALVRLYLALMTGTCLGLAGLGELIVVEGPLAKDLIYCGLLAAITGCPVHVSKDATGTSVGAAMLFDKGAETGLGNLGDVVSPMQIDGLKVYVEDWRVEVNA